MSTNNPSSSSYPETERNKLRRLPAKGHYDKATVHGILDSGSLCHVSFQTSGQPFVVPTLYGRENNLLYLHGSRASRMMRALDAGIAACIAVTHVDGLVLARSAFHHSMNFRSVMIFGTCVEAIGDEKMHGLHCISENVLKDRWDEVRSPSAKELNATTVLRMTIDEASAKIRTGPPVDDDDDYALPVWAGVVPMHCVTGQPEADPRLSDGIGLPQSVVRLLE